MIGDVPGIPSVGFDGPVAEVEDQTRPSVFFALKSKSQGIQQRSPESANDRVSTQDVSQNVISGGDLLAASSFGEQDHTKPDGNE